MILSRTVFGIKAKRNSLRAQSWNQLGLLIYEIYEITHMSIMSFEFTKLSVSIFDVSKHVG